MTEVTQEDRERAWPFRPYGYDNDTMTKMAWHSGQYDHTRIIQAFAQHRINHTRPASTEPVDALDRDYTKRRIKELTDEGDGFWRPCSGCQESNDGCVSTKDYPYSDTFRCQPGSGCGECGGIGVIWDDTDWEDYAKFALTRTDALAEARSLDEWHEDHGFVTWWKFPVNEPAWIGTPNCSDWPGYHTHWTPHPVIPRLNAGEVK